MDTKPLESFAKAARRELIVAVEARISAVLAAGSVARSERAETVRLLEGEIADHGREHVIDRVAYTWFNRLIALRFMDARGYTDAGVVSPASGQAHGQPEILADAKRGDVDTAIVTNAGAHKAIIGLLDGTRRSTDAEGEAYALLLTECCRHWHQTMPFMFEAEGAYTELLVPAGLLADGALLSRAREVLTEDVCDDVEVIGWLYQFYISERKNEVFAGFKKNKKAGADEIPAATQLFTPHWIVRYLLENSLGRLWMLNRPASRLVDRMDYYIAPVGAETDFLRVSGPEELTVIDPACGSGHMLTYAFDLLYAIYEEEGYAPSEIPSLILSHNLHGTEIDPRAGALASFALTMKARAKDRRFLTRSGVQPRICVIEPIFFAPDELDLLVTNGGDRDTEAAFWTQFRDADVLGSLIQPDPDATRQAAAVLEGLKDQEDTLYYDTMIRARKAVAQADALGRQYSVVTANPPYMGSGSFNPVMRKSLAARYKVTRSDLYAIFLERSLGLTNSSGYVAMITMQGWMFTTSYESLRKTILAQTSVTTLAQFGTQAFESIGGEVVATAAFVLQNISPSNSTSGVYLRLVDGDSVAKERGLRVRSGLQQVEQHLLSGLPSSPIVYWEAGLLSRLYEAYPAIGDIAPIREGIHTGNNSRFLRFWWEVSQQRFLRTATKREDVDEANARWVPYNKGGTSTRWYGNNTLVLAFDAFSRGEMSKLSGYVEPSKDLYFKAGGTWSDVGTGGLRVKAYPEGYLFADKGPVVVGGDDNLFLIGAMNSSTFGYVCELLMPTISYKAGTVKKIPLPSVADRGQIVDLAAEAIALAKSSWDEDELSWDFTASPGLGLIGDPQQKVRTVQAIEKWSSEASAASARIQDLEELNNQLFLKLYEMSGADVDRQLRFIPTDLSPAPPRGVVEQLISYAIGCMFGRYSLDQPGLILADQGATLQDYLAKVVSTGSASDVRFMPDADNVIPFVDDGWFEDDVVEQFRQFLKVAFGTEHFEENLRFVEESLGVKALRDYFITKSGKSKFYDDHVKRYKKRPIYWMFSSPKGSFNALIYLHRYTPSTVSTVLNEYLREYENKLQKAFERAEVAAAGGISAKDQKEADRLRKVLAELRDYEHDVLYPLATQQVEIDLDDGVKMNYPKFYPAVKKIAGLEASDE